MKDRLLGLEAKERLLSHTNKISQAAYEERTREIQNQDKVFLQHLLLSFRWERLPSMQLGDTRETPAAKRDALETLWSSMEVTAVSKPCLLQE